MKLVAGTVMLVLVYLLRFVNRVRRVVIRARLWVLDRRVTHIDRVRVRCMQRMFRLLVKLGRIK